MKITLTIESEEMDLFMAEIRKHLAGRLEVTPEDLDTPIPYGLTETAKAEIAAAAGIEEARRTFVPRDSETRDAWIPDPPVAVLNPDPQPAAVWQEPIPESQTTGIPVTRAAVKDALSKVVSRFGKPAAGQILAPFGAKKIGDLEKDQFHGVILACETLIDNPEAQPEAPTTMITPAAMISESEFNLTISRFSKENGIPELMAIVARHTDAKKAAEIPADCYAPILAELAAYQPPALEADPDAEPEEDEPEPAQLDLGEF